MPAVPTNKQAILARARERMECLEAAPVWSDRQKIALACRILFDAGHDSGLAGQITARVAQHRDRYYTQAFGVGFDEMRPQDILVVDPDLKVLDGAGMPNPANRFHSWIYQARPEVGCIIHTHAVHASALSMLEVPLMVSHMDSCVLHDDCAFLPRWPGVPVGDGEGQTISAALGGKRAVLLAHHGLVVAGSSIEEACAIALQFERAARLQLLAMAAGTIKPIPEELGREAHDWILAPARSRTAFAYHARRAIRSHPEIRSWLPGSPPDFP